MKNKKAKALEAVAKDIIALRFKGSMTLNQLDKIFFDLMRKHGIKQGTKSKKGAGVTMCTFEWSMCRTLYMSQIQSYFTLNAIFKEVPKDLVHY